jgi:hypothetical protein
MRLNLLITPRKVISMSSFCLISQISISVKSLFFAWTIRGKSSFLALSLLLATQALSLGVCNGGVITTPTDLAPGAKYYLVFVTGAGTTGLSSNISDYDAFVNNEASQVSELSGITWKALGSTSTVSARVHLNIGDFPIYRLDNIRIADNATDLWDGSIANATGGPVLPNSFVWTGSNTDGTASSYYLGSSTPILGFTAFKDSTWINLRNDFPSSSTHRMLAVSQLLTVGGSGPAVPEPATITFWSLTASLGFLLRGRFQAKRPSLA